MRVLIILVAASDKQYKCFWPSYNNSVAGHDFDLLVVHRNNSLPTFLDVPYQKSIQIESKVINGKEIEHRAFGAYREFYYRNQYKYDIYGFISDDVVIKRNNWLPEILKYFSVQNLGFVGTQIFNQGIYQCNDKYPHPSHMRSPCWFATNEALSAIDWEFNSDHDGEMKIADQFVEKGFFGVQAGNKINIAYDALEENHITQLMEKYLGHDLLGKFNKNDVKQMKEKFSIYTPMILNSPYSHIGQKDIIRDLEPYDGLIYDKSLDIATKYVNIKYQPMGTAICQIEKQ